MRGVLLKLIPLSLCLLAACQSGSLPPEILHTKDGSPALLVPSGYFEMGTAFADVAWFGERGLDASLFQDEIPEHQVYLNAFYMDLHEVTNAQYEAFLVETHRDAPPYWHDAALNADDQPVVGVSWVDAVAYCRWAGKRLPSEAEWEKAARGHDARLYPWGSTFTVEQCNAAILTGEGSRQSLWGRPVPVQSPPFGESPYRVRHMAGNVSEWVADWYAPDYYATSPTHSPVGPRRGTQRVVRGGSWEDISVEVRCAARQAVLPENPEGLPIGFRCARDAR